MNVFLSFFNLRRQITTAGLLFLIFMTGCSTTHEQFLSDHWVSQTARSHFISTNSSSSRLQIIITYDGLLSSHSALRLESDQEHVTFWDPAGAYGLVGHLIDSNGHSIKPYGQRVRDIVVTHIPDIPSYLKFRWYVGDSSVEIFEWDLSAKQTESLREVLQKETDETHPQGEFHTETAPAFCSIAISDFLKRFAPPPIQLTDTYFFPHNLGEALLNQFPTRVRIFFPGQEEIVFVAPQSQIVGP
ncbi:hypothetical protein [Candidatus Nitronereus thalassa]|uniref:Lipoprotein n=1 Tax=Candidatus Nitronereus thalassa TaxID=3020898 RepID=A0ABU3K3H3_9BACT|nr:hypothetical protein [Candidatus Nitronereus thalassa]MDT7040938.1 hypothetical protein [Candidatus Nitronereus thalassa]